MKAKGSVIERSF